MVSHIFFFRNPNKNSEIITNTPPELSGIPLKISLEIPSKIYNEIPPSICPKIQSTRKCSTFFFFPKLVHKCIQKFLQEIGLQIYQSFLFAKTLPVDLFFILNIFFKELHQVFPEKFLHAFI